MVLFEYRVSIFRIKTLDPALLIGFYLEMVNASLLKALFGELKIFLGETYNVRLDTDNV
jgi:hypothetical protein